MIAAMSSTVPVAPVAADFTPPLDVAPFSALLASLSPPPRGATASEPAPDAASDDDTAGADSGAATEDRSGDGYAADTFAPTSFMLVGPIIVPIPPSVASTKVAAGSGPVGTTAVAGSEMSANMPAAGFPSPRNADAQDMQLPVGGVRGVIDTGAAAADASGGNVGGSSRDASPAAPAPIGADIRPVVGAVVRGDGSGRASSPAASAPTVTDVRPAMGAVARADGSGWASSPVAAATIVADMRPVMGGVAVATDLPGSGAGGGRPDAPLIPPSVDAVRDVAPVATFLPPAQGVAVALAYPRPSLPPPMVVDRARGRATTSDPVSSLAGADLPAGDATPIAPDMTPVAALNGAAIPFASATPSHAGAVLLGSAAPAEATIQHHLDVAHDGAWLDRLASDIAASADKGSRMRFQLNPERLGSLHVEIAPGADGAAVRFTTDNEAARAMIADAQPQLVAEARAQGMRIAETQVDLSGQNSGRGDTSAFAQTQQQQQQNQPGGQRVPLFDRPGTAMTRSANGVTADPFAARAERYA